MKPLDASKGSTKAARPPTSFPARNRQPSPPQTRDERLHNPGAAAFHDEVQHQGQALCCECLRSAATHSRLSGLDAGARPEANAGRARVFTSGPTARAYRARCHSPRSSCLDKYDMNCHAAAAVRFPFFARTRLLLTTSPMRRAVVMVWARAWAQGRDRRGGIRQIELRGALPESSFPKPRCGPGPRLRFFGARCPNTVASRYVFSAFSRGDRGQRRFAPRPATPVRALRPAHRTG